MIAIAGGRGGVPRLGIVLAAAVVLGGPGCGDAGDARLPSAPPGGARAPDAPTPILGVAEPNAWRFEPALASPAEIARSISELGATSQRFLVDWNLVEPRPPVDGVRTYDFRLFDAMYDASVARGIRPLLIVANAPAWAADAGAKPGSQANNPPAPARLPDWAAFVEAVARRYPEAIGIEVWNEPNLVIFWGDGVGAEPDPARYASVLETAFTAVRSANPELPVIGGALSPTRAPLPPGDVPPGEFAAGMLRAGGAGYMDAISLHPYPGPGGVENTLALTDGVRSVRDAFGARLPIWLTEVGATTTGPAPVTETEQASLLVSVCEALVREPDVEAVYFHTLIERTGPASSPQPGFGVMRASAAGGPAPKPAFTALRGALSRGCEG